MTKNRAWEFTPDSEAFRLECIERPFVEPGPGQILVKVGAVSINYRDLINLRNEANRPVGGKIACSDAAGVVVSVGAGVTAWKPGDQVAGCFFPQWQEGPFSMAHHRTDLGGSADGVLAEYIVIDESGCVAIPENWTVAEAATLPCAAVTAWASLMTRGQLRSDETVLILGTGGVAIFALQFAAALGARSIVVSRSADKLNRAKSLGAWQTVDRTATPEWDREVWQLTGKQGVDHVIEVGGPGTLGQSLASVAAGGKIALIGVLSGFGPPQDSLFPLVTKNASIHGIYVGSRADFLAMNQFIEQHDFRPVIDRRFHFEEADQALSALADGEHFGKIVVDYSL